MEKHYRITAVRKGDTNDQVTTTTETLTEAEGWVKAHRTEEGNAHAYQVMTVYRRADGWQGHCAYYLLNGMEVDELVFLNSLMVEG